MQIFGYSLNEVGIEHIHYMAHSTNDWWIFAKVEKSDDNSKPKLNWHSQSETNFSFIRGHWLFCCWPRSKRNAIYQLLSFPRHRHNFDYFSLYIYDFSFSYSFSFICQNQTDREMLSKVQEKNFKASHRSVCLKMSIKGSVKSDCSAFFRVCTNVRRQLRRIKCFFFAMKYF